MSAVNESVNNTAIVCDGDLTLSNETGAGETVIIQCDGDGALEIVQDTVGKMECQNDGECGIMTRIREGAFPAYTGSTQVTPTQEAQVLHTGNKSVYEDITINPIPSNYGLISWNGSILTVS